MSKTINLGRVTAYADAVAAGYTGTREQFANDLANAANYAAEAGDAAETATEAATTASTAAGTATTKAEEASADADQAHADAQAILGAKETAVAAANTASSKAGEAANSAQQAAASETAAAGSATAASNAATSATASKNAAATSETNAANSANAAAHTLTNVNQAGVTQVAAIQAKGTEVLNSIPADYTALSNDVDDLKSDLNGREASTEEVTFTAGGYITTGNVTTVNLTPTADATSRYAIVDCEEGYVFEVSCKSYTVARAWCFIDSNNSVLSTSDPTGTITQTITAPSGAVKAIFNDDATSTGGVIKTIPANAGLVADVSNIKTSTQLTDTIGRNTSNQTVENYDAVFNRGVLNLGNVAYKRGGVNLLTGEYNDASDVLQHQMVCFDFTPIKLLSNKIILHIKTGYEARGVLLNPDKSYNSYFNWTSGGTIPLLDNKKGYYAIMCVGKADSTTLSDEEVASAGIDTLWVESDFEIPNGIIEEIKTLQNDILPFYGKKIVNFGDSIFGNFRDTDTTTDKSISTMIAEALGATVYNAGFGGCRMGYHSEGWRAFSMYALADAITTGVWTAQDAAIANPPSGMPAYFSETLAMLKTLDFSKIDYITIGYGVNDYTGNAFINYQTGLEEYQYFKGALEYSLRTILETYPSIRIAVITPCWMWFPDADTGLLDYSSDDAASENTRDYKLTDYVNACETVCEAYHVPCINTYNGLGFNPYSYKAYFNVKGIDGVAVSDGTHPKQAGRQLRADRISGELIKLFCH